MANYLNEAGLTTLLKGMKESITHAFSEFWNNKLAKVARTNSYKDLDNRPNYIKAIIAGGNTYKGIETGKTVDLSNLATKDYVSSTIASEEASGNLSYEIDNSFSKLHSTTYKNGKWEKTTETLYLDVHNQKARDLQVLCSAIYEATADTNDFNILSNLYERLYRKLKTDNNTQATSWNFSTVITSADKAKKMSLLVFRLPVKVDNNTDDGKNVFQNVLITNYSDLMDAAAVSKLIPAAPGVTTDTKARTDYVRGVILLHGYIQTKLPNTAITLTQAGKDTNTGYHVSNASWDRDMPGRIGTQLADNIFMPITIVLCQYMNYTTQATTSNNKTTYKQKTESKFAFLVYNDNAFTNQKIISQTQDFIKTGILESIGEDGSIIEDSIAKQSSVDSLETRVEELERQMGILEEKFPDIGKDNT